METILQYIPAVLSAILLAVLILMVITNIIVEVVKKLTWDKVPTNLLAFIVAMAVTLLAGKVSAARKKVPGRNGVRPGGR